MTDNRYQKETFERRNNSNHREYHGKEDRRNRSRVESSSRLINGSESHHRSYNRRNRQEGFKSNGDRDRDYPSKRKLMWGKGNDEDTPGPPIKSENLHRKWESIIAASSTTDSDKFQRLMGMKKSINQSPEIDQQSSSTNSEKHNRKEIETAGGKNEDEVTKSERQRQQDIAEKLQKQYEVAHATTLHFGRRGFGCS